MTKQWQTVQFPLAAGLQQKADPRALQPPGLLIAKDVQFEEVGGLQHRRPYQQLGGTLSNVRRVVGNGAERIALTSTGVYSWSPALATWVEKGTHLAVKVDEVSVFSNAGDQLDADRAELGNVVFFSWIEEGGAGYLAALDKTTGAVLRSPATFSAGAKRARLVALTTRVLLVFHDGIGGIYAYALDPAAPSAALGSSTTVINTGISAGAKYDIVRVGATDTAVLACNRTVTTSYSLLTITAGLVVTATTKARSCNGAIAVSVEPTGAQVQVIRANATNVQGDLVTISGFVDVYTGQAIGTTPTNPAGVIAACHRSVQDSGVYRCYAFWASDQTSGASDWYTSSNWVSTGNTLGTEAVFKRRWAPRARAFDRSGQIYVWGAFFGRTQFDPFGTGLSLQATYFLLRDDGFLTAKAVTNTAGANAGGIATDGDGWLPGCQDLGSGQYAFAAVTCRVIETGTDSSDYAARSPREVVFTFDSDQARRTARLGQTLYIACGEGLLQYDGAALLEVGFHQAPWYVLGAETAGGLIATNGTYAYKLTWRAANAKGETERSSSSVVGAVALVAAPGGVTLQGMQPLYLTHRSSIALEAWRTEVNPTDEDPFHLVTSKDPASTTNPNRFLSNDQTASALPIFNDELADTSLATRESNPENGGLLESVQPPPATIIVASADRLFLAGIAGDPHRVWYSKQRGDNEVVAFNDALTFTVPREGGDITGLAFLNETLIVFRETAIYAVPGDGFDNLGGGSNFGPARLLASDVGAVSAEAIAFTPQGLVFKSSKGWYLLDRGWSAKYIGASVSDYDSDTVVAVHVVEGQHQVRCLTSSRMLVWDYLVDQWAEWTIASGVHAAMCDGTYHYAKSDGVYQERSDFTGIAYGMVVQLAPIKLNDLQGAGSVRWLNVLGEHRGNHRLQIDLYRDYATTPYQTTTWTPSPGTVGEPFQVSVGPSIPKCVAIGVKLTVLPDISGEVPSYSEALKLTGIALEVGIDRGINRRLPVAQRT